MKKEIQKSKKMRIRKREKKSPVFAAALLSLLLLTGCSGKTEATAQGMKLIQELDYQGALAQFELAEEQRENARLVARGRGIACMGLTDYEQSIVWFREALAESDGFVQPVDFDLNYYLAAAYTKNGQAAEAETVYDAILALRPQEEDAYFLRGCVRLEQSEYEEAKEDFDRVLSMDALNFDRLIDIYEALEHYGYQEVGQIYLQNALDNQSGQMTPYDTGRIYFYMGEYQKAYLALEEAREKGGAESYLYLGRAYEATGDYNYASSVYNSYLSKDASNAEIYNQLGLCELAKQDYRAALEAFQAGLALADSRMKQTLSFNEVVAYEYLGEYSQASLLLNAYLETYPDDEKAQRERDFLSTR